MPSMHSSVIIPFRSTDNVDTLNWALDGFARQELASNHTMEVFVGIDGGNIELRLQGLQPDRFKFVVFPPTGAAGVRNALAKMTSTRTNRLIFANADTRPFSDMVQQHCDAGGLLAQNSLVLGNASDLRVMRRYHPRNVNTLFQ